jgi:hypothetical protein
LCYNSEFSIVYDYFITFHLSVQRKYEINVRLGILSVADRRDFAGYNGPFFREMYMAIASMKMKTTTACLKPLFPELSVKNRPILESWYFFEGERQYAIRQFKTSGWCGVTGQTKVHLLYNAMTKWCDGAVFV